MPTVAHQERGKQQYRIWFQHMQVGRRFRLERKIEIPCICVEFDCVLLRIRHGRSLVLLLLFLAI
jgi:hypothetical protein